MVRAIGSKFPHTEETKKKMSESAKKRPPHNFVKGHTIQNTGRTRFVKGRKYTEEEKVAQSIRMRKMWKEKKAEILKKRQQGGANHWNWQGGKTKVKYPEKWTKELKRRIMERDKFKCYKCKSNRDLVVHHKDGTKENCNDDNLITMCRGCHVKLHAILKNSLKTFI